MAAAAPPNRGASGSVRRNRLMARTCASWTDPRAVAAAGAPVLALLLGVAGQAQAQVIEIGGDGEVAVYDRPAVFTDDGARTIAPPKLPPRAAAPTTAPAEVKHALTAAAAAHELDPALVEAVAWRESRLRQGAVSPDGRDRGDAADAGNCARPWRRPLRPAPERPRRRRLPVAACSTEFGGDLTLGAGRLQRRTRRRAPLRRHPALPRNPGLRGRHPRPPRRPRATAQP